MAFVIIVLNLFNSGKCFGAVSLSSLVVITWHLSVSNSFFVKYDAFRTNTFGSDLEQEVLSGFFGAIKGTFLCQGSFPIE